MPQPLLPRPAFRRRKSDGARTVSPKASSSIEFSLGHEEWGSEKTRGRATSRKELLGLPKGGFLPASFSASHWAIRNYLLMQSRRYTLPGASFLLREEDRTFFGAKSSTLVCPLYPTRLQKATKKSLKLPLAPSCPSALVGCAAVTWVGNRRIGGGATDVTNLKCATCSGRTHRVKSMPKR